MSSIQRLGFTGTRNGMTECQKIGLRSVLSAFDWLHHGCCVGADEQAHAIAKKAGKKVHTHPPIKFSLMASVTGDGTSPPRDYLDRDIDIVTDTCALFAAPAEMVKRNWSGTWFTIKQARLHERPLMIVFPDGTIHSERWSTLAKEGEAA